MTTDDLVAQANENVVALYQEMVERNEGKEEFNKEQFNRYVSEFAKDQVKQQLAENDKIPEPVRSSLEAEPAILDEFLNHLDLQLPAVTNAIFNMLDKDHDGTITKREVFWTVNHIEQAFKTDPGEMENFATKLLFNILDENQNGTIEANELVAFIRSILQLGANVLKAVLAIIPLTLDSEQVNLVTHISQIFTVLDTDNGGTLSIEELVAPLEDMSTIENPQFQMVYTSLLVMNSSLPAQYETVEGMDRVACHIAGLEPGTFSDGGPALKAKFMEAAQLSNSRYVMDKEDFVNLLLSQTQVNISKVFAAAIRPVMEFAKGPNSGLNARFTSSLRTGLEALGQWLEGGGMKGLIISCCDMLDANGDGQIDIEELERMTTKPQNAKEFLTLLFAIADGDSDGELTEEEVMKLVHKYVKVIVAVWELLIDGMVEVSMAAVRPVVTSILDAYNAPLGFTFETLSAAIREGPEATSQRLMILGMSLQHTMQMVAMAASADMQMN